MPFDPNLFMQQQHDGVLDTERKLVPEGEYTAMIGDITEESFRTNDFEYQRGPKAGQPGSMTTFSVPFKVADDRARAVTGFDVSTVFMDCILDLNDDGSPDFGPQKNIKLGQVRAAVNQNQPGPWGAGNLSGAGPVMIKVIHKKGKRKDGSPFERAEVERVVPIR